MMGIIVDSTSLRASGAVAKLSLTYVPTQNQEYSIALHRGAVRQLYFRRQILSKYDSVSRV